jgi:acyl transferase domain-containing protein
MRSEIFSNGHEDTMSHTMANGTHEGGEDATMPIAVVGIGFRGSGDAVDIDKFWDMIREKREARTEILTRRFNNDAFYHPDAGRNGTSNVAAGHFFQQDLAKFDGSFFNMTSAEATALDPQQRLLLECTYEAFENGRLLQSAFHYTDC